MLYFARFVTVNSEVTATFRLNQIEWWAWRIVLVVSHIYAYSLIIGID